MYFTGTSDSSSSDFLKQEKTVKVMLPADTKPADLGPALKMREFKVLKSEGEIVSFNGGTFNTSTGEAIYTIKAQYLTLPF